MAKVSQARMYSWWWDSHISPKNSRWLQENLTDMDSKVKSMIKLIEEDADSFARRAEMYYKKRPELMKLVEEFYRAYRALAERYDNATGVLKQAHRTMTEAFPNQNPMMMADELHESAASEMDPRTPEMSPPIRGLEPDDLQKDALGLSSSQFRAVKSNGVHTEESDSISNRKSVKQLNNMFGSGQNGSGDGRVKRGLNFHEAEVKGRSIQRKDQELSEVVSKFEKEIQTLKETLLKLEAEKEAGLAQYQESLERLSKLESEVSRAQEDSKGLNERANKADDEVRTLKEALAKLGAEKEATLLQYQQNVEKIANLEQAISHVKEEMGESNEQARLAKTEAEALKQDLSRLESEKDAALVEHRQSLEMIANLESKLLLAEEHAKKLGEIAEKAETEVESLKKALAKLMEEKEAACLQYEQCLATISSLEDKLSSTQEEAQRLRVEIDSGAAKLKVAEEQCHVLERSNQSLHSELESLVMKSGAQSEELTEKQKELGRLWTCIQEERLRFIEAETAFQTLQHLHNQTQEELRSMASELQNRTQLLRDFESHNQSLQDEVEKIKEENKGLSEINISSSMSIKDMQTEIFSLRESNGKLEEEVDLRVDQRNALQQEIYCLKEELNELSKKHSAISVQIEGTGLNPDSFGSSVKELQEENLKVKEAYEKERGEKVALLEKLEIMEQLLEKNALLEISLADLSAELEGAREKILALEDSFEALLEEKSTLVTEKATLITQLQETTEKLEKLSEKNTFLENSLVDAHDELEGLKKRSKTLEDSCQLLENEKSSLINEKDTLDSQVVITQQSLNELEMRYRDLEEKYSCLEKERDIALHEVESLFASLDAKKEEHETMTQMNKKQLASMESEMHLLQDEGCRRRRDLEQEFDKSYNYQLEIFILQRYIQDLKENGVSLSVEFQQLLEASKLSEQLISELRNENVKQQVEVKTLSDETGKLKMGMHELLIAFGIHVDRGCDDEKIGVDQTYVKPMLTKLDDTKSSLRENVDKSQQLEVETSVLITLLDQLRKEAAAIAMDKAIVDQELRNKNEELSMLQIEANKLQEIIKELKLQVKEKDQKDTSQQNEIANLQEVLLDMQEAVQKLQKEKSVLLEENGTLEVETSVLITLLDQLRKEAAAIAMDKAVVDHELRNKNEELSMLQIEANKLQEIIKELKLQVKEKDQKDTSQQNEIVNLQEVLSDMQEAVQKLQKEKSMLLAEKGTLTKELLALEGHTRNLEDENLSLLGETLSLSHLSLIFEHIVIDKSVQLEEHSEDLENLHSVNGLLEENLSVMLGKMEEAQLENMQLKELLSKSGDEIASIKDLLDQKEIALSEAEQKVSTLENTQHDLQRTVEDLKKEHDEVKTIKDVQERQILKLFDDSNHLSNEKECLREAKEELSSELQKLREEHEMAKNREQSLFAEVEKGNSEIGLLESEVTELFGQLQMSVILQVLLEEKIRELTEACKSLGDEAELKGAKMKLLKDTNITLEGENGGLKAKLGAYALALNSLDVCISSLEDHLGLSKTLQKSNQEVKDAEVATHDPAKTDEQSITDETDQTGSNDLPELQNLQTRLKAIEKTVMETEHAGKEEVADVKAKLEAATKEIEDLKLKASMNRVHIKRGSEISESEEGLLTKDIMLDQVSECSSYGINRRENFGSWDTADLGGSFSHAADMPQGNKTQNSKLGNSEIHAEKEGKLEISKTFSGPRREVSRTKILQRLNSDVQKLTNLQITVQDLKKKVGSTERSKNNAKAIAERENTKSQLDEAEEAILKLFDVTGKLSKGVEESPFSGEDKAAMGSEERENLRRRRLSEQARRVSEKIGRLQLEIQKIQFVLLRFDSENEKESRERSRVAAAETSRRVLLRDYLYGAVRSGNKKKRAAFCACVRPPTKGD